MTGHKAASSVKPREGLKWGGPDEDPGHGGERVVR